MAIDCRIVGTRHDGFRFEYDWRTVVLYALGVGATRNELDYLFEERGPKVLPSFAVVPPAALVERLFRGAGGDVELMVHGSQAIRLHRPIPPAATLESSAWIAGVYDLKKLTQVNIATQTTWNREPLFETEWTLLFREGGSGGPPPPKREPHKPAPGAEPSFHRAEATRAEQALLYRLSGDLNPLHADPELAARVGFEAGPILHGLCTFGFVARSVVGSVCGGDGDRLLELGGQFRRPVWPGDTLETTGYEVGPGRYTLDVRALGRTDPVMTSCWAVVRPGA